MIIKPAIKQAKHRSTTLAVGVGNTAAAGNQEDPRSDVN